MRKLTAFVFVWVCILALVGCDTKETAVPDTPNAMFPAIMHEGKLYRTTGKAIPAEVDESAIVGEIRSVVPLTQLPSKNGEANFGQTGDPYAMTADGLLVIMQHEWVLFELAEDTH